MKKTLRNGDGDCILITGGAGFPGSSLANALAEQGRRVRGLNGHPPLIFEDGKQRRDFVNCYADISQARQLLGYQPQVSFNAGITEFARWLAGTGAQDNFVKAAAELDRRRLTL